MPPPNRSANSSPRHDPRIPQPDFSNASQPTSPCPFASSSGRTCTPSRKEYCIAGSALIERCCISCARRQSSFFVNTPVVPHDFHANVSRPSGSYSRAATRATVGWHPQASGAAQARRDRTRIRGCSLHGDAGRKCLCLFSPRRLPVCTQPHSPQLCRLDSPPRAHAFSFPSAGPSRTKIQKSVEA
jgi:hypothetical protein